MVAPVAVSGLPVNLPTPEAIQARLRSLSAEDKFLRRLLRLSAAQRRELGVGGVPAPGDVLAGAGQPLAAIR